MMFPRPYDADDDDKVDEDEASKRYHPYGDVVARVTNDCCRDGFERPCHDCVVVVDIRSVGATTFHVDRQRWPRPAEIQFQAM